MGVAHGERTLEVRSFVGGALHAEDGAPLPLIDPATGEQRGASILAPSAVPAAVAAATAAAAGSGWAERAGWERAAVLRTLADLLPRHADELARLETLATGKPLHATRGEVQGLARWYHFFAAAAETAEQRLRPLSCAAHAEVLEEPIGVVAAISPFNGALSLGSWKVAPALAAGNAVVLKPPPAAAASSVRLAELALEAGLPDGVLNAAIADAEGGERLCRDERVGMVSFTGSTAVALRLGGIVGARMGRFACEAGGKSAQVVFADADLDAALVAARQGAFSAAGQTCVAGSRLLVQADIFDEFTHRLAELAGELRQGDPSDPATDVGPLASRAQLERVSGYVERAYAEGATALVGGGPPELTPPLDGGFWFAPTVLTGVHPGMEIWREEVFGPVTVVASFDSEEEAIELANGVRYGLAAGVWTRDAGRAHRVARRLLAGTVWVNTYRQIDWRVPFGGYKQSGLGRENGLEALREYTQTKAVVVNHGPVADPFATAAATNEDE